MHTEVANSMREINDFVNAKHIQKDDIINVFPTGDGLFAIVYYAED